FLDPTEALHANFLMLPMPLRNSEYSELQEPQGRRLHLQVANDVHRICIADQMYPGIKAQVLDRIKQTAHKLQSAVKKRTGCRISSHAHFVKHQSPVTLPYLHQRAAATSGLHSPAPLEISANANKHDHIQLPIQHTKRMRHAALEWNQTLIPII